MTYDNHPIQSHPTQPTYSIVEQTRRDRRKLPPVTETSPALHCYYYLYLSFMYITEVDVSHYSRKVALESQSYNDQICIMLSTCMSVSLNKWIRLQPLLNTTAQLRWVGKLNKSDLNQFQGANKLEPEFDNLSKKKSQQAIRGRREINQLCHIITPPRLPLWSSSQDFSALLMVLRFLPSIRYRVSQNKLQIELWAH